MIHHLIDGVPENPHRHPENKQRDDQAGDRFHHRHAHPRPGDTDQRADGGKRVAPLMPGFGVQCRGTEAFRVSPCIPEKRLFRNNGNHRRDQGQKSRRVLRLAADDCLHRVYADGSADQRQNAG